MATEQRWCEYCERNVRAVRDEPNIGCAAHFGFLLMWVISGLLTFWLSTIIVVPLWIMTARFNANKFECPVCGDEV